MMMVIDSLLVPLAESPLGLRTAAPSRPFRERLLAGRDLELVVLTFSDLTPSRRGNQSD